MAIYNIYSLSPDGLAFHDMLVWGVVSSSSKRVDLKLEDGSYVRISGAGFTYDASGHFTGGVISSFKHLADEAGIVTHATLTGLAFSASDFAANISNVAHLLYAGDDIVTAHLANVDLNGYGGSNTVNYDFNGTVHAAGGQDLVTFANAGLAVPSVNNWISYEFRPDGSLNTTGYHVKLDLTPQSGGGVVDTGSGRDLQVPSSLIYGTEYDTLIGIDNIRGSHGDDYLEGHSTGGGGTESETYSIIYGLDGDDVIQRAQYAYGGEGDDIIYSLGVPGFSLSDEFISYSYGGAGHDTFRFNSVASFNFSLRFLDGGEGIDTVKLNAEYVFLESNETSAFYYVGFTDIENLEGGNSDNYYVGNDAENQINTYGGNDRIEGLWGADMLNGGDDNDVLWGEGNPVGDYASTIFPAGNDTLIGEDGDDQLFGQEGNDILMGGGDDDLLNGGRNTDTASYADASSEVVVDLSVTTAQNTLGAGNDTLASIENLTGSQYGDRLLGDASANVLNGAAGDDRLTGANGNDVLLGGDDDDTLIAGSGADRLDGGSGDDILNGASDGRRDVFVFAQSYDHDRINSFEQTGSDRIELDEDLWGGGLTVSQVISTFGVQATANRVTLNFGNGDVLDVLNTGGIDLATLHLDILIV